MSKERKSRWLTYAVSIIVMGVAIAVVFTAARPASESPSGSDSGDAKKTGGPPTRGRPAETVAPRAAPAPSIPVIENARYRKTSRFDPGTLRVYLRNGADEPLIVKQVLLDGLPISTWGVEWSCENVLVNGFPAAAETEKPTEKPESAALRVAGDRVHWARLTPNPVPPSGIGEFSAKLANAVDRPLKVEFVAVDGRKYPVVIRHAPPTLTISAVTFSEDLGTTYIYAVNESDKDLRLRGVEVDGIPVVRNVWFGSKTLPPGAKDVIIIESPRTAGAYMTVRLVSAEGPVAEERVRVLTGFPIGAENEIGPKGMELDDVPYFLRPDYVLTQASLSENPETFPPHSSQANHILTCAMHIYGRDYARAGREIFRRHDLCQHFDPHHPTTAYLCRSRPEIGYALFAETADILCCNPNIPDIHLPPGETESPSQAAERFARLAYLAARPRPFVSLASVLSIYDKTPATVSDFRARTYTILAAGAKGILYRNRDFEMDESSQVPVYAEAVRLNKMLRSVRTLIAIADPVDWAVSDAKNGLRTRALLAGDKALLVFLMDQNTGSKMPDPSEEKEGPSPGDGEDAVHIKIAVPPWVELAHADRLDDDGQPKPEFGPAGPGVYELRTPPPTNGASLFLLPIVKE